MSTAHGLFVPESNSKALFPTAPSSKPTSEIIPRTCHINHEHPNEEEEEEEEIIIPTTTTITTATTATAVSVSVTLDTEENNKEAKDVTVEFCDDNEDDGYHTPTSPRHRILVDMKYPPPPPKKKKPSRLLYVKRKERTARARVWVDIDGEISSFLCVELLDETSRRRKKAKTF